MKKESIRDFLQRKMVISERNGILNMYFLSTNLQEFYISDKLTSLSNIP